MESNPYQPPEAKLVDETVRGDAVQAERMQRFLAAFIDGLIALAIGVPVAFLLGSFDYARRGIRPPFALTLAAVAIGFVSFVLIQGWFLHTSGQTIGKKVIGIRIVDIDGKVPPITRMLGLRYLPTQLAALIPVVGGFYALVDVLFIFRQDHRCLHDLVAGTRVVKVK